MSAIDELLTTARSGLDRLEPAQLQERRGTGQAVIVDIRPHANRAAEGEIPGSVIVERIVLEWRLDPSSDHRLPGLTADTPVVIICNEGYSSSLAAADAARLGLAKATDLVGGFRAWRAAGLPVVTGGNPAVS
ncbi:rhodanese-like domain-containing protein [Pseudonocardiaceae bacterium YIM PH 21723]|nr:rhodanese-like domain-containing protein [Pseudonocardiaceae bacterium YIM PH 21723]